MASTLTSVEQQQNRGPPLAAYNAVMIVIPVIAVALRLWSRMLMPSDKRLHRFWWDDWVVVMALVSFQIKVIGGRMALIV